MTRHGPPKAWTTCIRLPDLHSMSCLCVEQLGWFLGLKTHCWDAAADQWDHHAHFQCQRMSNGMQTHGLRNGHQPTYPSKTVASWSGTACAVSHSHPNNGVHQTCIIQETTVIWCDAFPHAATFKGLLIVLKCFTKIGRLFIIDDQQAANFGLFICTQSALHVSGDVFVHHQEHLILFYLFVPN